jgi:uncharacterized protein YybS (DUF2232 family)
VNRARGLSIWLFCLGALLLAFLGGQINPVVYLLTGVMAPLPVLVVGWRLGPRAALALALTVALAIFSLKPGLEIIAAHLGFGELLLMGVILSILRARGVTAPRAIILTVAALGFIALVYLGGEAAYLKLSPQELLARKTREVMEIFKQFLESGGAAPLPLGDSPEELESMLQRLLPGLVVANLGLVAWINVVAVRQLAFALGWAQPDDHPLYYWSLPEWLIFVALAGGFLLLVPVTGVRLFGLNLLIILGVLYFSQGVAVVAAWFHRFAVPRVFRMVVYLLLFINPLVFLVALLGLMDLWFDFRRLHRTDEAKSA